MNETPAEEFDHLLRGHVRSLYRYAYRLTGQQVYRTLGTNIFNTSVSDGVTFSHKHYDQQFRSSGYFPAYLSGSTTTPPAPQPPTNLRIVR